MTQLRQDPWIDASFEPDPAVEAERQAARRVHRETVQIPRLRAIGNLCLFAAICLHNLVFLGGIDWPLVLGYGALQAAYTALTSASLRRSYRVDAPLDLGTVYLATDIVVFVLAVYVSGGERSWLLPVLCVRVADQSVSSQRRARAFAHITLVLHALLAAELCFVEQRVAAPTTELAKVALMYLMNLYLVLAAGPSDKQRKRAMELQATTRKLIGELASKSEQLEREHRRAEAASRAKGRFLANMSHEIRTPMNGVLGAAELLMEEELGPEQTELAETIVTSARSLLGIVNDILDMSKIEAGELRLERTALNLEQLIDETLRPLRLQAEVQGIALRTQLCHELTLPVLGDPLRLQQVLINLLGNALKFTSAGEVKLSVTSVSHAVSILSLRFCVRDTGIGMDEATKTRIFEPFQQADDSTTRRFGGTGLGLSISRQLIEMMGGQLRVESEPGVGSSFSFELALPLSAAAPEATNDDSDRALVVKDVRARAPSVLVVEDTAINRLLVRKMLEHLGCSVQTLDDGAAAVEHLTRPHDHALVLMDWHMPTLDGLEAIRRVRAFEASLTPPKRTPILAFTASAFADEIARCRAAGADGVLNKPLTKLQLLAALERHVLGRTPSPSEPEPATSGDGDGALRTSMIEELMRVDADTGGGMQDILASFLDSGPTRIRELAEAVAARDASRIGELAHRFRGTAANFGAVRLAESLSELERLAQAGELARVDGSLTKVAGAHQESSRLLRACLSSLRERTPAQA